MEPQSKHTTHFSVTDAAGNAVALTTTLNSGFGSAELERLGHRLTLFTVPTTGWTIAATIQRTLHSWEGKADPRLQGLAAGY